MNILKGYRMLVKPRLRYRREARGEAVGIPLENLLRTFQLFTVLAKHKTGWVCITPRVYTGHGAGQNMAA